MGRNCFSEKALIRILPILSSIIKPIVWDFAKPEILSGICVNSDWKLERLSSGQSNACDNTLYTNKTAAVVYHTKEAKVVTKLSFKGRKLVT